MTMMIVVTAVPIALTTIRALVRQSADVQGTIAGVQQDQTASSALLQYLHGATTILAGSNATTLDASVLFGVSSGVPQTASLQSVLHDSSSPAGDAVLETTITTSSGRSFSVTSNYAVNSDHVFTYYYNDPSSSTTAPADGSPAGLASTTAPTTSELSEIVAVQIAATFLSGPHTSLAGDSTLRASNFDTTVYLQNSSGAPAPASTTSLAFSGGTSVGSTVTVTATVSPVPDGGTVTFSSFYEGSPTSICSGVVAVSTSTGEASCSFTPSAVGTYGFEASFSGTSHFQPSSAALSSIAAVSPSATAVSATGGGSRGTLVVDATFTASPIGGAAPTGTATVVVRETSRCWWRCSSALSQAGALSPSTSNPATTAALSLTFTGLVSGATYSVTVTYGGDGNYAGSVGTTSGTAS